MPTRILLDSIESTHVTPAAHTASAHPQSALAVQARNVPNERSGAVRCVASASSHGVPEYLAEKSTLFR